jgi:anti-anti-sigma factor
MTDVAGRQKTAPAGNRATASNVLVMSDPGRREGAVMDFGIRVETVDGRVVCVVEGELDLDSAYQLKDAARALIAERGPALVVDLSAVTFVDCAGLGALLVLQREAHTRGGHVAVTGAGPTVSRLLRLAGLESWFLGQPGQLPA